MSHLNDKYINNAYFTRPIKGLVFSGGGPTAISYIGTLEILQSHGLLSSCKYFAGSSSGAIYAAGMACGASIDSMINMVMPTDFENFLDGTSNSDANIRGFYEYFGWYNGDILENWICQILEHLTGKSDITFKEIYERYGNFLDITATDVTLGKTIYLNANTRPDLPVKDAIRWSTSIPFFFRACFENVLTPVEKNDNGNLLTFYQYFTHWYIDGGVLDNFPIDRFDSFLNHDEVLGLKLISSCNLEEIHAVSHQPMRNITNIVEFANSLIAMLLNSRLKTHINSSDWKRTLPINIKNRCSTNFKISKEEKLLLIEEGRKSALKFLGYIT